MEKIKIRQNFATFTDSSEARVSRSVQTKTGKLPPTVTHRDRQSQWPWAIQVSLLLVQWTSEGEEPGREAGAVAVQTRDQFLL